MKKNFKRNDIIINGFRTKFTPTSTNTHTHTNKSTKSTTIIITTTIYRTNEISFEVSVSEQNKTKKPETFFSRPWQKWNLCISDLVWMRRKKNSILSSSSYSYQRSSIFHKYFYTVKTKKKTTIIIIMESFCKLKRLKAIKFNFPIDIIPWKI